MDEQIDIYNSSLIVNGEEFTKKYVAEPDCSEHQTGLAIDLAKKSNDVDFICPEFPYDGICQRFREVSVKYGFIERYKEEKKYITKISGEPWHFRYVGYPHSEIMTENNLALEEYLEFIKQYKYHENPYIFTIGNRKILISYKEYVDENISIDLSDNDLYKISGNNYDGFIITVWR
ncbi:D-alanyl-D-alanine carboxypeptidase family protein [Clostridium disporicum]|uniref:D-alanyl-D-alanine carboxypeptidase family protein n=1 Tax=Clostridium disporicum TaxID=84024 RepID=UPI003608E82B